MKNVLEKLLDQAGLCSLIVFVFGVVTIIAVNKVMPFYMVFVVSIPYIFVASSVLIRIFAPVEFPTVLSMFIVALRMNSMCIDEALTNHSINRITALCRSHDIVWIGYSQSYSQSYNPYKTVYIHFLKKSDMVAFKLIVSEE